MMEELDITTTLDTDDAVVDTVEETTGSGLIGKIMIFGLGLITGAVGAIATTRAIEHKKTVTWFDREIRKTPIFGKKKQDEAAPENNETDDNNTETEND